MEGGVRLATYCNDDPALAVQQLNDLTTGHSDLNAVVAVGGWPLFVPEGCRNFIDSNADRFKSGKLVAVSADTLPSELQLLKEGYVAALVGQRPFEMGEKAMDTLLALHDGKPVQADHLHRRRSRHQRQCRRVPEINNPPGARPGGLGFS